MDDVQEALAQRSIRFDTAKNLRFYRARAGISQVKLAGLAGCSISTVSLAERGGFLTDEWAEKFAAILECEATDIKPPKP